MISQTDLRASGPIKLESCDRRSGNGTARAAAARAPLAKVAWRGRFLRGGLLIFLLTSATFGRGADVLVSDDYNQWKRALGTNQATTPESIVAPPGFRVDLVRSAQPGEGSWVALAFDPKGRIVLAREDRGLLRLTLPADSTTPPRIESINTNLLECRGLLFAHGALYANANNSKGLFRLRDTDGDENFDEVKLLRSTPGGVGHGRNQLALGPDGLIYSIHGDDVGLPDGGAAPESPLRHSAEDHLVPCAWDKVSFNSYARMPYGHLIRTDPDGRRWELVAGGLRNPYGIAFNEAGDAFTYDADMEWDVGLPWYHPTRVLHLVPGGDYGWRRGTGVLPVWSPDTLPSAADIGVGSPTAVQFGTRSRFPEPWRRALFILDWAYGKIFAVHLQAAGASYAGRSEVFISGRPLNVTGIDFGPDGAMYFTTGGRRTQSGLYRVRWAGPLDVRPAAAAAEEPAERYEQILTRLKAGPLDELWIHLGAGDPWTRYAARTALEARPPDSWRNRALTERAPIVGLTALLALARAGDPAKPTNAADIARSLLEFPVGSLTPDERILAVRTLAVCFSRSGPPEPGLARRCLEFWESRYPDSEARVNQALCELLVYLESTNVVRKTLPLLASAATQNEKFHYLFLLRGVKAGWTLAERRTYFDWLVKAGTEFHGANTLPIALKIIRQEATAGLSTEERAMLADALALLEKPTTASSPASAPSAPTTSTSTMPRKHVREWTLENLADLHPSNRHSTNLALGSRLFVEAGCAQCHRFSNTGGVAGPDLTAVGSRFDRRTLLESILEPSRVVAEVYRTTTIITRSGDILDGRLLAEDAMSLTIGLNPADPAAQTRVVPKSDIESRRISELSPMPAGLVNTLDKDEILALVSWLEGK